MTDGPRGRLPHCVQGENGGNSDSRGKLKVQPLRTIENEVKETGEGRH